jgi:uncharacterized protein YdeI (YjbR/CyaY-like superfamily)
MAKKDPRIDAYVAKSAAFAKPILIHLRKVIHEACPDVQETMKWSFPHFMHHGILCSMAAFKQHCAFGFWKGSQVVGKGDSKSDEAMGQFGRIASLADLPTKKTLAGLIKSAMKRNESAEKAPAKVKRNPRPEAAVPDDLFLALRKNRKALATFDGFSPSHRREYIEWITEAKRPETRLSRITTTIEWLAEGKPRHWKYAKC